MSRLQMVAGVNFKGRSFSNNFVQPITVFVGENDRGKSSRLEAITLAISGYLPGVKRTGQAIMELASADKMIVRCLATKQFAERIWTRSPKGVISAEENLSGIFKTGLPPVLLDPSSYFRLSARERVNELFGLIQMDSEESAEDICTRIRTIPTPLEHVKALGPLQEKLCTKIMDLEQTRQDEEASFQVFIDQLVEELRKERNEAEAHQRRMSSTVQGIAEIKATTGGEVLTSDPGEVSRLRDRIQELRLKQQVTGEALNDTDSRDRRTRELQSIIDRIPDLQKERAALTKDQEWLSKQIEAYRSVSPTVFARYDAVNASVGELEGSKGALNVQMHGLRENRDRALQGTQCPVCLRSGKGRKTETRKHYARLIGELLSKLNEVTKALTVESKVLAALDKERNAAIQQDMEQARRIETAVELKSLLATNAWRIESAEKAQAELKQLEIATPGSADKLARELRDISQQIELVKADLTKAEARERDYLKAKAEEASAAKALMRTQANAAEVELLKAAVKIVEELQQRMVAKAFQTVLTTANALTEGILPGPLCFKDGDIGMEIDLGFVSYQGFGGRSTAMAYAAIALALGVRSPLKLVLMDELGRFDETGKKLLLHRLINLVESGTIHQFIGADVNSNFWLTLKDRWDELQVIQL